MYHIIVNPASKTGKGERIWHQLSKKLAELDITYQVYFTKGVGGATEYAKEITESLNSPITLIILGGDGTINEVVQGIANPEYVHIGYIPTGSSNDLARDLGLETDAVKRLEDIINTPSLKRIDLGCITYQNGILREDPSTSVQEITRLFVVSCGIGFDAAVCEEAIHSSLKTILNHLHLGKLTYLGIALKQIIRAPFISCDLILDDREAIHFNRILFVANMIHRYEGGGFMFCPKAVCDDGIFDLCVAGDLNLLQIFRALPRAFHGTHTKCKGVSIYTAKKITIETSDYLWVHTDGEVHVKANKISLTTCTHQLQFIC